LQFYHKDSYQGGEPHADGGEEVVSVFLGEKIEFE